MSSILNMSSTDSSQSNKHSKVNLTILRLHKAKGSQLSTGVSVPTSSFWYAVTATKDVSGKSVEMVVLGGPLPSPGAERRSSSTMSLRKYLCMECSRIYRNNR